MAIDNKIDPIQIGETLYIVQSDAALGRKMKCG
jgi:hypothetical protein